MVSVDGLAVEFGGTTLFSDISFVINDKDRIALWAKTVQENPPFSRFLQASDRQQEAKFLPLRTP